MNLEAVLKEAVRKDLEEYKRKFVEECVEEYRESIEANIAKVIDNFIASLRVSIQGTDDPVLKSNSLSISISCDLDG